MAQNTSIFGNLEQIKALLFHKIKFSGNIFLMDTEYIEGKEYDSAQIIELQDGWFKLYDDYYTKSANPRFKQTLKKDDQTLSLLLKINMIEKVVALLEFLEVNKEFIPSEAYFQTVASLGNDVKRLHPNIKFNSIDDLKPQILKIKSVLGGLQSRYEILFKKENKGEKVDEMEFYNIRSNIEDALGRNLPEVMNMLQWIAYENKYLRKVLKQPSNV